MRGAAAIVVLFLATAPAALAGQGVPGSDGEPVLRAGDAVRIVVWRNEELTGEFDIGGDGTIRHPLYRELNVAGLTAEEAESRVREFLTRFEASPQFVLEPLFRVAVGGEVRAPDLYTLAPETTIGEAVARAGGVTGQGRLEKVTLIRDGREWQLDLMRPELGLAQLRIRSGDQILVHRRTNWLRDYIAPVASILGAAALIVSRLNR